MQNLLTVFTLFIFVFSTIAQSATLKFQYDQAGNTISSQGQFFEYNDANQLVKVRKDSPSGPIVAEYVYDYQGQRVKKIENGITTYYIGKHYEERKGNTTNEQTNYFFANNQRIAKKTKVNDDSQKLNYYLNNHLSSADVVIDDKGNELEKIQYYPFGEYRNHNKERYSYTGKERDVVTSNFYYEARYYNPFVRRFTQADAVTPDLYDPQSLNRYTYTRNSPLVYNDPSGHIAFLPVLGAVAVGVFLVDAATANSNAPGDEIITKNQDFLDLVAETSIPNYEELPVWKKNVIKGVPLVVGGLASKGYTRLKAGKEITEDLVGRLKLHRPYKRKAFREQIEAVAPKTSDGKFIDPNTGKVIEGDFHYGHKYGRENWRLQKQAEKKGMSQKEYNDWINDHPDWFQIEDPYSNMSHKYEKPK